jgi:hypothetical protein
MAHDDETSRDDNLPNREVDDSRKARLHQDGEHRGSKRDSGHE